MSFTVGKNFFVNSPILQLHYKLLNWDSWVSEYLLLRVGYICHWCLCEVTQFSLYFLIPRELYHLDEIWKLVGLMLVFMMLLFQLSGWFFNWPLVCDVFACCLLFSLPLSKAYNPCRQTSAPVSLHLSLIMLSQEMAPCILYGCVQCFSTSVFHLYCLFKVFYVLLS
jgi:hypothetical protein